MNVPFHKSVLIKDERKLYAQDVDDIMTTGMFTGGKHIKKLEELAVEISNRKFAVAFSSGTAALYCAIRATKMGANVITTPVSWYATTNAIAEVGGHAEYYDVDSNGLITIPPPPAGFTKDDIKSVYGGILPVSLYGQKLDTAVLVDYIVVPRVLDAAHSINQMDILDDAKTFDIMCFSLHPTKLFFAGEGGIAVTDWEHLYCRMKMFRYQGLDHNKRWIEHSLKFVMPETSAALGYRTLSNFAERKRRLCEVVRWYRQEFDRYPWGNFLTTIGDENVSMMTIKVEREYRDELLKYLKATGVNADIKYPSLRRSNETARRNYPGTFDFVERIITLPCFIGMEKHTINNIVTGIWEGSRKMRGE
jgi:dTDP-4-amino-4,6-dideoxygalactose transaminase